MLINIWKIDSELTQGASICKDFAILLVRQKMFHRLTDAFRMSCLRTRVSRTTRTRQTHSTAAWRHWASRAVIALRRTSISSISSRRTRLTSPSSSSRSHRAVRPSSWSLRSWRCITMRRTNAKNTFFSNCSRRRLKRKFGQLLLVFSLSVSLSQSHISQLSSLISSWANPIWPV